MNHLFERKAVLFINIIHQMALDFETLFNLKKDQNSKEQVTTLTNNELFIPFSLFFFRWFWPTNLRKCLFTFFKSLACLALQTETIVKKITQPKLPKTKNELTKICNEPGISDENQL